MQSNNNNYSLGEGDEGEHTECSFFHPVIEFNNSCFDWPMDSILFAIIKSAAYHSISAITVCINQLFSTSWIKKEELMILIKVEHFYEASLKIYKHKTQQKIN